MNDKKERVCAKCGNPLVLENNFYRSNETNEYLDTCKKCFTMHINIYEQSSFLHLLKILDVPYIEQEWKNLVERYGNNPKTSSTAIFGRYIAKMKLQQFSKYRYADTQRFLDDKAEHQLQELENKRQQINKYRENLAGGEEVIAAEDLDLSLLSHDEIKDLFNGGITAESFVDQTIEDPFDEKEFTAEDKKYLISKWGRTYTIQECVRLEKLYLEMIDSYDIRTASHFDYLLKICRVSLKADQALEVNDIEGYQKLSKVYDILMKSAKFTAAQNKETSDDFTDSVGVIVALCEQQGFIPRFHEERQDIVDLTKNDINGYLRNLVMEEMNLGNMIEIYLQKMQMEENRKEDTLNDEDDEAFVLEELEKTVLEDRDFEDFSDMIEEDVELDEETLRKSSEVYAKPR